MITSNFYQENGTQITAQGRLATKSILSLTGLGWDVERDRMSVRTRDNDGKRIMSQTEMFCNYRKDEDGRPIQLGYTKEGYQIVQNSEAFSLFDEIVQDQGYVFDGGGHFKNGSLVWLLLKHSETNHSIAQGDDIQDYFLLANSHDGKVPLVLKPTPIRVVCQNTLNAALRDGKAFMKFRHTRTIADKMDEIKKALTFNRENFKAFIHASTMLASTPLEDAEQYFGKVFPEILKANDVTLSSGEVKPNAGKRLLAGLILNFKNGKGNHGQTYWDAYNAITQMIDHERDFRPENWVQQTQFGHGHKAKQVAWTTALKMAS